MKRYFLAALGVAASFALFSLCTPKAEADSYFSDCDPCSEISCDPCDPCGFDGCGPKRSLWTIGGWAESGLFVNEYGQKNSYVNGMLDPDSGNTSNLQNVRQSDFQLNQLNLFLEKKLDTRRSRIDFGGRVDVMYGTDALLVQSAGLEYGAGHGRWNSGDYYTALAQMYFEAGYRDVSVKIGKFLSPLGSNSVFSPDRFFYSLPLANTMTPYTVSGGIATWKPTKKFSAYAGWVNGEDQFFDTGDDNAFLGGFEYQWSKRLRFAYGALIGKDKRVRNQVSNVPHQEEYFLHSFLVGFKPGKRWDYTFEWTLRNEKGGQTFDSGYSIGKYDGAYGINNELVYRVNSRWSLGGRMEWKKFYFSTHGPLDGGGEWVNSYGDNMYSFSVGAKWSPREWLVVRPELRYDKYESWTDYNAVKGSGKKDQLSGGFSTIVRF